MLIIKIQMPTDMIRDVLPIASKYATELKQALEQKFDVQLDLPVIEEGE